MSSCSSETNLAPAPESEIETDTEEGEISEPEGGSSSSSAGDKKEKRKRCSQCKKKLTVVNEYECRCGKWFCSTHRYAEAHSCSYDYKEEGKRILTKANPVIVAPKVAKI